MTTPAAPNREIIVRSFQPGCTRAAAHKGGHADRTKHAGFLHFGGTAVAPNEVIGKSDLMSQVAGHYRGRKAASAFTSRTFGRCLATERTASATSRRLRSTATALWRRFLHHHCRVRRCRQVNVGGPNRAPADERDSFVHLLM